MLALASFSREGSNHADFQTRGELDDSASQRRFRERGMLNDAKRPIRVAGNPLPEKHDAAAGVVTARTVGNTLRVGPLAERCLSPASGLRVEGGQTLDQAMAVQSQGEQVGTMKRHARNRIVECY